MIKLNILKRLITSLCLIGLCITANPAIAAADNLFVSGPGVDCSSASTASSSAVCAEDNTTNNPLTGCPANCGSGTLDDITNIVAYIAGAAAIIVIIVSGIRYITSSGDAGRIGAAKGTITGAIIGLVVISVAKLLITYVITKINP
jgi:Type IV secretion system pilin